MLRVSILILGAFQEKELLCSKVEYTQAKNI